MLFVLNAVDTSKSDEREAVQQATNTIWSLTCFHIFSVVVKHCGAMAKLLNILWDTIWQCHKLHLQLNVLIGLASAVALGHPRQVLMHCWHSRTGFEHRLS